ncbi:MAG: PepSY-associated TM helix domain-containing protein [bacterium]|nr:PepSY-associated TM helix domain-containing protein [bacterium]MDT8366750.1 PepSY-associated TM helix domain-containing protein [bacterium]
MLLILISGVLLNHIHGFNSNYKIVQEQFKLPPEVAANALTPPGVQAVLDNIGESRPYDAVFQPDSDSLHIFVAGSVVEVDLKEGSAMYEKVAERPILKGMNDLHLNRAGKLWTWMADIYAVAFGLLSLTGLFVLTGRKGITGRGAWLTGIGVAIPIALAVIFL